MTVVPRAAVEIQFATSFHAVTDVWDKDISVGLNLGKVGAGLHTQPFWLARRRRGNGRSNAELQLQKLVRNSISSPAALLPCCLHQCTQLQERA